jgi:deoxyribonuclease V
MQIRSLHSWHLTPTEAVALQRQLAGQVDVHTRLGRCDIIAGADISYNRFSSVLYAGVVVLRRADWCVVETQGMTAEATFPYRTGLLTFREAPALLEVFARLRTEPDVVIVDGAGFAHPRRIGLASHLGLCLDRPCVGCAKSRLLGDYEEPDRAAGSVSWLCDKGEVVGSVVRTKTGVKPLFVSVGHRIDLAGAVRVVLESCRGYRVPEPTRQAHLLVNRLRREAAVQNY